MKKDALVTFDPADNLQVEDMKPRRRHRALAWEVLTPGIPARRGLSPVAGETPTKYLQELDHETTVDTVHAVRDLVVGTALLPFLPYFGVALLLKGVAHMLRIREGINEGEQIRQRIANAQSSNVNPTE